MNIFDTQVELKIRVSKGIYLILRYKLHVL
jgi:hypothetical protein